MSGRRPLDPHTRALATRPRWTSNQWFFRPTPKPAPLPPPDSPAPRSVPAPPARLVTQERDTSRPSDGSPHHEPCRSCTGRRDPQSILVPCSRCSGCLSCLAVPLLLVCCARPCPSWCGSRVLGVCVAPPPVWWRCWVPMSRTPSCPTRLPPPCKDFTSPYNVDCPVRVWLFTALLPPPWPGISRRAGHSPRPCGVRGHLVERGGEVFADGSLGARRIRWLLQCSHLMVPLCLVVCPVGARLIAVCGAVLCPVPLPPLAQEPATFCQVTSR